MTLNDPVYAEAALALARRMQAAAPDSLRGQITTGWRRVVSLDPSEDELAPLLRLHERAQARYRANPEAQTARGADTVELAALSAVAEALLNLDLALTR